MIIKTEIAATHYFNDTKRRHRPNGPAVVWSKGGWSWWLNDHPQRYYGPADHRGDWWIHGLRIRRG